MNQSIRVRIFVYFLTLAIISAFPAGHTWITIFAAADFGDDSSPIEETPADDPSNFENNGIGGNRENDAGIVNEKRSRMYIFKDRSISARAGDKTRLRLCMFDSAENCKPAAYVTIYIYDSDKYLTDKKVKTNSKGTAVLTFEKSGTYYAGAARNESVSERELCRINVKEASVEFVNKVETLKIRSGTSKGMSKKLAVKVNGTRVNASGLTWRVGNPKIASVKNGRIKAKKEGKTTLYATIYHTTAKCGIIVLDKRKLLVIDPGHQERQDTDMEPVAPGAKEMKIKVSSGTAGKYSGNEYQLNLAVSKKLKKVLLKKNYRVIMTRTTNQVNISNKERAKIANESNADAFIRIHANSSASASASGIMTVCPTKSSPYCQDIYKKSRRLSDSILKHMKQETGTARGHIWETDTMTGINWSRVPVTIVELGYQSNPDEDRKLASDAYQDSLVLGIAAGLDEYFHVLP